MTLPSTFPCTSRPAETALVMFLAEHTDALITASALLGGRPAVKRTARLLEDALEARSLTRRMRRELVALHRLLSLDNVDDVESIEAACFAEIDPASPVVEQICELTDRLRTHLSDLIAADEGEALREEFVDAA